MVLGKGFFNIFQAVELPKENQKSQKMPSFFAAKQTRNNQ